ncbi:hypothetical protein ES703_91550 [subsurface metagenome]
MAPRAGQPVRTGRYLRRNDISTDARGVWPGRLNPTGGH